MVTGKILGDIGKARNLEVLNLCKNLVFYESWLQNEN